MAVVAFGPTKDYTEAAGGLDEALAEAKRLGVPMTLADLNLGDPVPTELNAAPLLVQMNEKVTAAKIDRALIGGAMTNDPEQIKAARPEIERLSDILAIAERAAELPHCQFDRKWEDSINVTFPEYSGMRSAIQVLNSRAILQARDGNGEAAIADLRTASAIARHMRSEPILISMLTSNGGETLVGRAVIKVFEHLKSEKELAALKAALSEGYEPIVLADYIRAEAYFGSDVITNLEKYGGAKAIQASFGMQNSPADNMTRLAHLTASSETMQRAFLARHLQTWNEVYALGEDMRDNDKLSEKLMKIDQQISGETGVSYEMQRILNPFFGGAADSIKRRDADRRASLAALDVLQYKAKTGRYPATLAESGADYTDPYSGQPLRYELNDKGFKVWSVGSDLKDDGGKERKNNAAGEAADQVISFPPSHS